MAKKHNVSSIISDKLYLTIKDAVEQSMGFELRCYQVKVDKETRTIYCQLPQDLKKQFGEEADYKEKIFFPFCKKIVPYWEICPFDSIGFDEKKLMLTLHLETDDVIKAIEDKMLNMKDDEILVRRNNEWCVTKYDNRDFKQHFLGIYYGEITK